MKSLSNNQKISAAAHQVVQSAGLWSLLVQRIYITPTVLVVPNASEQGTKSEVARKWAAWPHNPCRPAVITANDVPVPVPSPLLQKARQQYLIIPS